MFFRGSNFQFIKLTTLLFLVVVVSGCSSTHPADVETADTYQSAEKDPRDPLEKINRPLWTFTEYADEYVARPVSVFYADTMPVFLREGLFNISQHFYEPSTVINHLLLLEFDKAAAMTGRFAVNTTVGLLGFFDPAADLGLERKRKALGEVLGKYGVPNGPYLIIPGLRASSVREEVGDYVDKYYWPFAALGFWPAFTRWAINGMEKRMLLIEQEDMLKEAVDPYEFVKNAYFQNMEFKVHDGNPPIEIDQDEEDEIDAYMDELDEDFDE